MTYVASTDDIDAQLEAEFSKIVTPEFQKKLDALVSKAAEDYGYELQRQLEYMLKDGNLSEGILGAARNMAQNFIERVQAGDDAAVEQFFGQPNNGYWPQRKEIRPEEQSRFGGLALRRKLVEAVQDRLESEVIKDQYAEIETLRQAYLKANAELVEWRRGERVLGDPA